jgi:hypothetical protein
VMLRDVVRRLGDQLGCSHFITSHSTMSRFIMSRLTMSRFS